MAYILSTECEIGELYEVADPRYDLFEPGDIINLLKIHIEYTHSDNFMGQNSLKAYTFLHKGKLIKLLDPLFYVKKI